MIVPFPTTWLGLSFSLLCGFIINLLVSRLLALLTSSKSYEREEKEKWREKKGRKRALWLSPFFSSSLFSFAILFPFIIVPSLISSIVDPQLRAVERWWKGRAETHETRLIIVFTCELSRISAVSWLVTHWCSLFSLPIDLTDWVSGL